MKSFKLQSIKHPRDGEGKFIGKYGIATELYNVLETLFVGVFITGFIAFGVFVYLSDSNQDGYKVPLKPVRAEISQDIKPDKVLDGTIREVTMYSSTPEQTDATPCIGANTQDVCVLWKAGQNLCATNAFPMGTELEIDKLGSCLVVDRMNKRFSERIDWYAGYDIDCLDGVDEGDDCPNYRRAWNFGKQNLLVNVK